MPKKETSEMCPVARTDCQVSQSNLATLWPIEDLLAHPDNPRTVRTDSPAFLDLKASIEANGILEPLTVREHDTARPEKRQVLSGHRRLAAAKALGMTAVPIRNLGVVDDALAFDIVAMANLHEELTPLEEGRRAALWLDKYHQDAAAVAGKLGKTARWVVEHAHVHNHLSAEWQAFAATKEDVQHWTISHWAVIAKLPVSLQAAQLKKFQGGRYGLYDRWSVKRLEEQIKLELNLLSRAAFDVATCAQCLDRSDVQPLLWGETVEDATGDKARCLNVTCWAKKTLAAQKAKFKADAAAAGHPDAVPISLIPQPSGYGYEHNQKLAGLRKVHKKLLPAERIEVVAEGTDGAVPAIVVHGKGRQVGQLKFVRVVEPDKARSGGNGNDRFAKQQKKRDEDRQVAQRVFAELAKTTFLEQGPALAFYVACVDGGRDTKSLKALCRQTAKIKLLDVMLTYVQDAVLAWLKKMGASGWTSQWNLDRVRPYAHLLGADVKALEKKIRAEIRAAAKAKDKPAKKTAAKKPAKRKAAKKPAGKSSKRAKGAKRATHAASRATDASTPATSS